MVDGLNAVEIAVGGVAGAAFGSIFDGITEVLRNAAEFTTSHTNIKSTLEALQPLIREIEGKNNRLLLQDGELKDLKKEIEAGVKRVQELSKKSVRNYCMRPLYNMELDGMDKSLKRLLRILQVQGVRDVKEVLVQVNDCKTDVNKISIQLDDCKTGIVRYGEETLNMTRTVLDLFERINGPSGFVPISEKAASLVEEEELRSSLLTMRHAVDEALSKPNPHYNIFRIEEALRRVVEELGDADENRKLDMGVHEVKWFRIKVEEGTELIRKCSNAVEWTDRKMVKYASKLDDLVKFLEAFGQRLKRTNSTMPKGLDTQNSITLLSFLSLLPSLSKSLSLSLFFFTFFVSPPITLFILLLLFLFNSSDHLFSLSFFQSSFSLTGFSETTEIVEGISAWKSRTTGQLDQVARNGKEILDLTRRMFDRFERINGPSSSVPISEKGQEEPAWNAKTFDQVVSNRMEIIDLRNKMDDVLERIKGRSDFVQISEEGQEEIGDKQRNTKDQGRRKNTRTKRKKEKIGDECPDTIKKLGMFGLSYGFPLDMSSEELPSQEEIGDEHQDIEDLPKEIGDEQRNTKDQGKRKNTKTKRKKKEKIGDECPDTIKKLGMFGLRYGFPLDMSSEELPSQEEIGDEHQDIEDLPSQEEIGDEHQDIEDLPSQEEIGDEQRNTKDQGRRKNTKTKRKKKEKIGDECPNTIKKLGMLGLSYEFPLDMSSEELPSQEEIDDGHQDNEDLSSQEEIGDDHPDIGKKLGMYGLSYGIPWSMSKANSSPVNL